jgi:hypothetical protein
MIILVNPVSDPSTLILSNDDGTDRLVDENGEPLFAE